MALLVERFASESRDCDPTTRSESQNCRRAQRVLFRDHVGVPGGSQIALEAENERGRAHASNGEIGDDSESDFEPSDPESSDSSEAEDEQAILRPIDRKRKRNTPRIEPKRFCCSQCRVTFTTPQDLAVHDSLTHPFVCDIEGCGRSFALESVAIHHVEVWHQVPEEGRLCCGDCDLCFITRHDLALHQQQSHHQHIEQEKRERSKLKLFVCDAVYASSCGRRYKKKDKLIQHIKRHHKPSEDGTSFECDRCDAAFVTRHERAVHNQTAHPGRSSHPPTPSFVCEIIGCGKSYSKREHLKRHVLATHDAPQEKPFGCSLCGVRFVYKHALARHHLNCHTTDAEKPYACSVCLLAFKKKSLLQAHSFVHTGVLPFECEDCGQRFLKRFQLVRHERKHASSRPAQAQVLMCEHDACDELLFSQQEKQQHMQEAHGVEIKDEIAEREASRRGKKGKQTAGKLESSSSGTGRELRCLVCSQVFARIQNLRGHLRTHFEALDERKLHACPMAGCAKAYTKKSNLMAHYNAAHDPIKSQRFKCPHAGCDGAFGYKKVLQTHITSIHDPRQPVKKDEVEGAADESDTSPTIKRPRRRGRQAMGVMARTLGESNNEEALEHVK